MPTYEYQCQKCGFEFERVQRIIEDPIKTCPECKSRQAKRLLSAPSFILKGGGWYADGYGSSGAKSDGDSGSSDASPSSGSDSSDKSSKDSSGKGSGEKKKKATGGKSSKKAAG